MKNPSISVIIPTLNAEKHLNNLIPPLLKSSFHPKILLIDSSSEDSTREAAQQYPIEILTISREAYDHGLTREMGRKHANTEIVVMMTQDAYPKENTIDLMIKPIIEKKASVAYARQVPQKDASFLETFARAFNYPPESQIRSLQHVEEHGIYTIFCSNSCAAYSNIVLDEIGGFPRVLFGEDTVAVAQILAKGHKIAYVAEAEVRHSHRYSLNQEFRRHFDIGYARQAHYDLLNQFGKDARRGKKYVKKLFVELLSKNPMLIPYAAMQIGSKWAGYHLGKAFCKYQLPSSIARKISTQKAFW